MDLHILVSMVVWTVSGAVLLFVLMYIDSLFTRYNDIEELKAGNMAVTTRFVMKLLAQAFILSSSIAASNSLPDAFLISLVSFLLLLILERTVRLLLANWGSWIWIMVHSLVKSDMACYQVHCKLRVL